VSNDSAALAAEREPQFKRRLESFSDIVFGLSLSELALQLGVPDRANELIDHPLRYVIFFASFAIICSFWSSHHRMFRYFWPNRADVLLNFTYLAFTVLVPFGMQSFLRFPASPVAFGIYLACFLGTSASMAALLFLALRRHWPYADTADRLDIYRRMLRVTIVGSSMALALALLPLIGTAFAGMSLWAMVPAIALMRRRVRTIPGWLAIQPALPGADPQPEA
jgi:uncharacterized membrane protein